MAQFTGTYDAFDVIGAREDLANDIFRVTPSDTPFVSAIGRTKAKGVFHEWQTDSLAAVVTNNQQIEGDDFTFSDPAATVRVGNRLQILRKTFLISNTADAIDLAGRESETALQTIKKGLELRRDIEAMCIGRNVSSVTGSSSAARVAGSLSSWLVTNDFGTAGTNTGASAANRGTSGGSTGFSSGNTVLATDGTTRTFIGQMLDNVIGKMYDNSGMVDDVIAMAGKSQKAVLTGFDGIAGTVYHEAKDRTIMATADVYASQFGDIKIMPNRYIRQTSSVDREVYLVRPAYAKLAILRPIQMAPNIAITGDATKHVLITECTLQVDNEAAHGIVADLS